MQSNPTSSNIDSIMSQLDTMEQNAKKGYSNYFDENSPIWDVFSTARTSMQSMKDNSTEYENISNTLTSIENKYENIFSSLLDEGSDYDTVFGVLNDDLKDVWSLQMLMNLMKWK